MLRRVTLLTARLDDLRPLHSFVEEFCNESGLSRDFFHRLSLVMEELFINTVKHGHGEDCGAPVWVSLSRSGDTVRIGLEDTAPAYNPFGRIVAADAQAEAPRRVGGLGVKLTRAMVSTAEYVYVFGRNHLRLSMCAGSDAQAQGEPAFAADA